MQAILKDAAAIANATSRTLAFRSRSDTIGVYGPDSAWFTAFDGGSYQWLKDDGKGGRNKDARSLLHRHSEYTRNGIGDDRSRFAVCAGCSRFKRCLFEWCSYKLTIPANVPAKDFWSLVVYDPQTRSMLQTDQPYPSKNNERNQDMLVNKDGSKRSGLAQRPPPGRKQTGSKPCRAKAGSCAYFMGH